ncbi:MAG: DoxX family protein [Microcoleaceae cyanobacterium MO_207.B10]|nr:DoxX family protein [Microcoleaceae cyanobacterium MO_207.B10]
MNKSTSSFNNYSLISLQIVIILVFLYHGVPKAIFWSAAMAKFSEFGLPGFLGPITGIVEVITSIFMLINFQFRWSSLVLIFIMAGAIFIVHIPGSIEAGKVTAGLERDLLLVAGTAVMAAFGSNFITKERLK